MKKRKKKQTVSGTRKGPGPGPEPIQWDVETFQPDDLPDSPSAASLMAAALREDEGPPIESEPDANARPDSHPGLQIFQNFEAAYQAVT